MPRSRGMTGERWYECAMCGFDYPESKLRFFQGKRRCTVLPCVDKTLEEENEQRGLVFVTESGGRGERNLS